MGRMHCDANAYVTRGLSINSHKTSVAEGAYDENVMLRLITRLPFSIFLPKLTNLSPSEEQLCHHTEDPEKPSFIQLSSHPIGYS